jgi:hypothetical protein
VGWLDGKGVCTLSKGQGIKPHRWCCVWSTMVCWLNILISKSYNRCHKLIKISKYFILTPDCAGLNAKNIIIGPSIPKDETCQDQVGMSRASYQCNIGVKQCCTSIWIFKEGPLALSVFLIFQNKIIVYYGSLKKSKSKNGQSWLFQPQLSWWWISPQCPILNKIVCR